ncbi:hypothetical protein BDP81DRAFT_435177 [Colletotrichum phormii]|uniref:Uncharacterized protein n=1 Tax=Colletotrichum phormii TaxID=359342 RepID=A0AAJ0EAZ9_9PEZI|nr:uncharacterized protein BDP81DRAFT_435177 [Colletotrichum phormii]KAK1625664.1 hypothetical protein BDP81DRAFT_435177 [Colletotrichum phormii]
MRWERERMTAPGGSQGPLLDDPGGYEEPLPTLGSWAKEEANQRPPHRLPHSPRVLHGGKR